jgi:hypothetical protein
MNTFIPLRTCETTSSTLASAGAEDAECRALFDEAGDMRLALPLCCLPDAELRPARADLTRTRGRFWLTEGELNPLIS